MINAIGARRSSKRSPGLGRASMKQVGAEAGGRKSLPSWARRFASAGAMAAFALIGASNAKAHVETFSLSGDLNTFGGPAAFRAFSGSMTVDFSDDFSNYEAKSIKISVQGQQSVFDINPSVVLSASKTGTIQAYNSLNDPLTLLFATPPPPSAGWGGFTTEKIFFGDVVVGGLTGLTESLFGATGAITRVSGPAIPDPPDPPAVPELSTWAMMLLGLTGLGLVAKGRTVAWRKQNSLSHN